MRSIVLITIVAGLAGCSGTGATTESSTAALQAANAAYDRALVDGDAQALAEHFTDDFQLIDDDANVRGKAEQIRMLTEDIDLLEARSDDVRITPLGREHVLLTGRFTGRYRAGGRENQFTERYTSVWVLEGGEWKVKHEHASLVPKAEPAAGS